jgi:hypothetical protein
VSHQLEVFDQAFPQTICDRGGADIYSRGCGQWPRSSTVCRSGSQSSNSTSIAWQARGPVLGKGGDEVRVPGNGVARGSSSSSLAMVPAWSRSTLSVDSSLAP